MNKKFLFRFAIVLMLIVLIIVFVTIGIRFFNAASIVRVNDNLPTTSYLDVTCENYTDILKDSHEHPDKYVGKKIKFVGFVYRLYDFSETQFVLAREMIISSNNEAVVVGFLCNCKDANNYKTGDWIEAEGVIEKGNYHGELPVINIDSLKKVSVPSDKYVFPPSISYLETE